MINVWVGYMSGSPTIAVEMSTIYVETCAKLTLSEAHELRDRLNKVLEDY